MFKVFAIGFVLGIIVGIMVAGFIVGGFKDEDWPD